MWKDVCEACDAKQRYVSRVCYLDAVQRGTDKGLVKALVIKTQDAVAIKESK